MSEDKLRSAVSRLEIEDRQPCVVILPLPGQPPGTYFREHDERMEATVDAAVVSKELGYLTKILLATGTKDKDGLSCARHMERQITYFAKRRGRSAILDCIAIGEEKSGATAPQIHSVRGQLLGVEPLSDGSLLGKVDLVVLISNWPHLLPAGVYFSRFIPEIPFVKWSSGDGRGCLNLPRWKYLLREFALYGTALTIDRDGHRFDKLIEVACEEWRHLRFPSVPYVHPYRPRKPSAQSR